MVRRCDIIPFDGAVTLAKASSHRTPCPRELRLTWALRRLRRAIGYCRICALHDGRAHALEKAMSTADVPPASRSNFSAVAAGTR